MLTLAGLVGVYGVTDAVIGNVMAATLGSPTSRLSFIVFMNELVRMLKRGCE